MREYSLTELNSRSGEVVEAAYGGPVTITRRGKRKFVIMTAEHYDALRKANDPRRVYGAGETPPDLAALLAPEVEKLAAGDGYDD